MALREPNGINLYGHPVLQANRHIASDARSVTINQEVQGRLFGEGQGGGTRPLCRGGPWDTQRDGGSDMVSGESVT